MHLLAAKPGEVLDGSEAINLGQTPGDIVVLSAADTDLACLAAGRATLGMPPLTFAPSLLHLQHPMSVDLYPTRSSRPRGWLSCVSSAVLLELRHRAGDGNLPQAAHPACDLGDDKPDPNLPACPPCQLRRPIAFALR